MSVRFIKCRVPHGGDWSQYCDMPAGTTIAAACGTDQVEATVDGRQVSATFIQRAQIKSGAVVRVEPINATPKDPVSLSIAAAAAGAAASAAAAASATAWAVGLSIASLALGVGSQFLAKKQMENGGSDRGSFNRLAAITGTANQIASFEPIPRVLGRMRYFPAIPMTAKPYTELKGGDQYYRIKLCLGYGPLEIGGHIVGEGYDKITQDTPLADVDGQRPIEIKQTDIAEYDDVKYEIGASDQTTIYTDQILEDEPGWSTESDAGGYDDDDNPTVYDNLSTIRTTRPDATGFSIDLAGQIYTVDSNGEFSKIRIQWRVEWRLSGSRDAWQSDTITQQSYGTTTSRENFSVEGLPQGRYDVRLTRVSTYFSNLEGQPSSEVTWTALRTIRPRTAFIVPGTVVMDLLIRATDQLQDQVDKISVLATSVLDAWDGEKWVKRPTRAHAWAFIASLTDAGNRDPMPLSAFNAESFRLWAEETEAAGRHYDNVLDNNDTVLSRMEEISKAGRALWTIDRDTTIRAVRDTVETDPVMVISPRNSSGYSYKLSAFDPPHAVKVRYVSAETWENTERIVYDDGYGELDDPENGITGATIFETIDAPGCTSADQAWKHGRNYLANMRLRAIEKHTFSQNIRHTQRYGPGSLLALNHPTIEVGLASGRIKRVTTNDDGDALAIEADEFLPMPDAGTQYGAKIQRQNGQVTVVEVVNNAPGSETVTLSEPVANLKPDDHVTFGEVGKITVDVKPVSIAPRSGRMAQVVCEPAAPEIIDAETGEIPAPPNDITVRPDPTDLPPNKPSIDDVVSDASVALPNDDGSLRYRLAVSVSPNSGRTSTARIIVQAKLRDDAVYFERIAEGGVAYFDEFGAGDVVDVRAKAVSAQDRESQWARYFNYTLVGRQPQKPTGISATRHTFSVHLDPTGGPPAAVHEFWMSGTPLDASQITQQATKLNDRPSPSFTATGLQPDTTHYFHVRRVNAYGLSDWLSIEVTTKNEPGAVLKNLSQDPSLVDLTDTLLEPIPLITAGEDVNGSVNQRLSREAADRRQEIADRVTSIDLVAAPGKPLSQATQSIVRERGIKSDMTAGFEAQAEARADALLNQRNDLTATIEQNQEISESRDESLANSLSTFAAGSGEQFDVDTIWYYDDELGGWKGGEIADGFLVPSAGDAPALVSPAGLAVDGPSRRYVKARIRVSGEPVWLGELYWQGADDSSWQGPVTIEEPPVDSQGVTTIQWQDIPWAGEIDQIRMRLTESHADADGVKVDWLAIGRPTPGASTAALQRERESRISDRNAQAKERETLAAQLRGDYEGDDPAQLTKGLVYNERQASASARESIAKDVSTVQAKAEENEAANTEERTARRNADSAMAADIDTLSGRMDTADGEREAATSARDQMSNEIESLGDSTAAQSEALNDVQARLRAFKLGDTYGFELGESGQAGAPKGWQLDGSPGQYVPAPAGSDYGSALAYRGDSGAWAITKAFSVQEGGGEFYVDVRTQVVAGHAYALLTCRDIAGKVVERATSNEVATDYDGVVSIIHTLPSATRYVKLSLRASTLIAE